MRTLLMILVSLLLVAGCLSAAIDGKYVSERKMNRGGEEMTITTTFDLKTDGNTLTGTVTMSGFGGGEPRVSEIKNGKVDGNKFSFTVTSPGRDGEVTTKYEGAVEDDTIKGTMEREGGQPRPFEAKKK
jgi:hypothetical protein